MAPDDIHSDSADAREGGEACGSDAASTTPPPPQGKESIRVDVWLWAVRQCKTRSLATAECRAGHVRVNGEPVKAATKVKPGDEVRYRIQGFDRVLRVTVCLPKRTSAAIAQQCYIDESPERPSTYIPMMFQRDRGTGRPTKKERRELDRLRGRDGNWGRRDH